MIGLVGTAILVTAMIGVFRFEAAQTSSAWDVAWPEAAAAGPSADGRTVEGKQTSVDLNVTARNVTAIQFTLAWADDVAGSAPDAFELRVTAPNGRNFTLGPEDDGTLVLETGPLSLVPEPMRVNAASAERAAASLGDRYANDGWTGVWKVAVVMVSAGDQTAPVGGVPLVADDGNEWTLATRVTAYAAEVASA